MGPSNFSEMELIYQWYRQDDDELYEFVPFSFLMDRLILSPCLLPISVSIFSIYPWIHLNPLQQGNVKSLFSTLLCRPMRHSYNPPIPPKEFTNERSERKYSRRAKRGDEYLSE